VKMTLKPRKRDYIARVGIFLIAVALIAGMIGCDGGGGATKYDLTMTANPVGGGTTTDLTGASPYAQGTQVDIQAAALGSYQFVKWTAPAGTFANPNLATTKFTMPGQNVTATAHFVGPLDYRKTYLVDQETAPYIGEVVYLEDQFGAVNATVKQASGFSNPAEMWHSENVTPIWNHDHHLTPYSITYEEEPHMWSVQVYNQFGIQNLTVWGPVGLTIPTQKVEPGGHEPPVGLDHFLHYYVLEGPIINETVGLSDQFGDDEQINVYKPYLLSNPVRKTHGCNVTEIWNPEAHLVFYNIGIEGEYFETEIQVVNQFGEQTLDVYGPVVIGVPSEMLYYEPIS
jgi:hypothetical protein